MIYNAIGHTVVDRSSMHIVSIVHNVITSSMQNTGILSIVLNSCVMFYTSAGTFPCSLPEMRKMKDSFEIVKPSVCRKMTEDEMEYEGGWLNFAIGLACAVTSVVVDILGDKGIIDKNVANVISGGCTAASIVLSFGTLGTIANVNAFAKLGKTMYTATRTTSSVMKASKASLCCDAASYIYSGFRQTFGLKW